jgi:hypothetical protein
VLIGGNHLRLSVLAAAALALGLACARPSWAQNDVATADEFAGPFLPALEPDLILHSLPVEPAAASAPGLNTRRILGVIPDYQTVDARVTTPLTVRQKWELAFRESVDPFNIVSAGIGAAFSQDGNQTPRYGEGGRAFAKRYGAALADLTTQNVFSAGLLATLLHQDPRYFRLGPEGGGIPKRVVYSLSRLFIARRDSGKDTFNTCGIGGMVLGIAASNLYYPAASVNGHEMAGRLTTSLFSGVTGNLMSEFAPDLQKLENKLLHRHKDHL